MTDGLQGFVSYPGIDPHGWESFDFTDLVGISPAMATIKMFPPEGLPDANGDMILTYGDNTITLKDMHVDAVMYEAGGGGQTATVRFLDERWAWSFYQITGYYNLKMHNGLVNPDHEKTPRELATLLFKAMQVHQFDVSALPNDARPECDWHNANAAQELSKICDDLGCRIVPKRSDGSWHIVVTGEGDDLPDGLPYNDFGSGIDPKERPDYIKVVTAPFRFQVCLELKAAGRDSKDQAWKDIEKLSYKPNVVTGRPANSGAEFGYNLKQFTNVDYKRVVQPDGSAKSPREFACETVFRSWRIADKPSNVATQIGPNGENQFFLPGYGEYLANRAGDFVTRKQLLITSELVESWVDQNDVDHKRPAFIMGTFYDQRLPNQMSKAGTRIDYQTARSDQLSLDGGNSFSIANDELDTDLVIVSTSQQMLTYYPYTNDSKSPFGAAKIFLVCAVSVREPDTWQPIRYEKLLHIGNGTNKDFCHVLIKEDIQPWVISDYNPDGSQKKANRFGGPDDTRNNKTEVDKQCDYYLNAYAKTFEIVESQTKTYYGFYPIDLDGAISQVTYAINKGGCDTKVSRGTEHDFDIPQYEDRLQRASRKNAEELARYQDYRSFRRTLLLGTHNTI
jgi:hypothetical protein